MKVVSILITIFATSMLFTALNVDTEGPTRIICLVLGLTLYWLAWATYKYKE